MTVLVSSDNSSADDPPVDNPAEESAESQYLQRDITRRVIGKIHYNII
jgi:hypothetical protein